MLQRVYLSGMVKITEVKGSDQSEMSSEDAFEVWSGMISLKEPLINTRNCSVGIR